MAALPGIPAEFVVRAVKHRKWNRRDRFTRAAVINALLGKRVEGGIIRLGVGEALIRSAVIPHFFDEIAGIAHVEGDGSVPDRPKRCVLVFLAVAIRIACFRDIDVNIVSLVSQSVEGGSPLFTTQGFRGSVLTTGENPRSERVGRRGTATATTRIIVEQRRFAALYVAGFPAAGLTPTRVEGRFV